MNKKEEKQALANSHTQPLKDFDTQSLKDFGETNASFFVNRLGVRV
jgi:hypothetical protein